MQYSFIDQTIYLADTTGNIYAKYNRKSLNEMKRNEEIFQKNIINKLNFATLQTFRILSRGKIEKEETLKKNRSFQSFRYIHLAIHGNRNENTRPISTKLHL